MRMLKINPYFLVDDVQKTAEWYRDVLGFQFDPIWGEPPRFVMVRRDEIQIMLRQPPTTGASVHCGNRSLMDHTFDAYVYVEDVDSVYRELKGRGADCLFEPHDQPHGCREFELRDVNGYLICFGQNLLV